MLTLTGDVDIVDVVNYFSKVKCISERNSQLSLSAAELVAYILCADVDWRVSKCCGTISINVVSRRYSIGPDVPTSSYHNFRSETPT